MKERKKAFINVPAAYAAVSLIHITDCDPAFPYIPPSCPGGGAASAVYLQPVGREIG